MNKLAINSPKLSRHVRDLGQGRRQGSEVDLGSRSVGSPRMRRTKVLCKHMREPFMEAFCFANDGDVEGVLDIPSPGLTMTMGSDSLLGSKSQRQLLRKGTRTVNRVHPLAVQPE